MAAQRPLSAEPVPHRVRAAGDGLPLLEYLIGTLKSVPPERLRQAVAEGRIRLGDGPPLEADAVVQTGQVLMADLPDTTIRDPWLPPPPEALPLLWIDDDLVVVDKAAGLLSYPMGPRKVSALSILRRQLERDGLDPELRPAHRLDRETTGALVLTRHLEADRSIKATIKERRTSRTYLAIARGWLEGPVTVDAPIGRDRLGPIRIAMTVREDGRAARTELRPLLRFGDEQEGWTWVEAVPQTGRTHQIRLHLSWIGHPIVGDKIYCDEGIAFLRWWDGELDDSDLRRLGMARHALHARTTSFDHPITGQTLLLLAPIPQDMVDFAHAHGGETPELRWPTEPSNR